MRLFVRMLLFTASILHILFVAPHVFAQEVYSWTDSKGNLVFGSRPPKNAPGLKKVGPHVISKYSSEKVVNGFKVRDKSSPSKFSQGKYSRASLKKNNSGIPVSPDSPKIKGNPAHLTYKSPVIKLNEKGEITSCLVQVTNEGKSLASDIVVQMTFPDGTFITASGPDKIKPSEQTDFGLPSSSVPLRISQKGGIQPTVESVKPEITVSYQ